MFGIYRTILAILVVYQHFYVLRWGQAAVVAFFCLSGFLMTLLIHGPYQNRFGAFAMNRFLRLYPAYWVTILITALMLLYGWPSSQINTTFPDGLWAWFKHIIYINEANDKNLIVVSYAVTNELLFYVLIGLGLSKTYKRTLLWVLFSVIFMVAIHIWAAPNSQLRFFSPLAATLPFSVGSLAYHLRNKVTKPWLSLFIALPIIGFCFYGLQTFKSVPNVAYYNGYPHNLLLFILVFVFSAVAAFLYRLGKKATGNLRKMDSAIGLISYPMYLGHFTMAIPISLFIPLGRSFIFGTSVLLMSTLYAIFIYWMVDRPMEKLRKKNRVRGRIG